MTGEVGPIIITAREVYDAVIRLTGRVDVLISQQSGTAQDVADHENRLRSLERRRWQLPGLATVMAGLSLVASFWHH